MSVVVTAEYDVCKTTLTDVHITSTSIVHRLSSIFFVYFHVLHCIWTDTNYGTALKCSWLARRRHTHRSLVETKISRRRLQCQSRDDCL